MTALTKMISGLKKGTIGLYTPKHTTYLQIFKVMKPSTSISLMLDSQGLDRSFCVYHINVFRLR